MLPAASKAEAAVERAVTAGEPAQVAKCAFQLAQSFHNFYHQYPIIHEPPREKKAMPRISKYVGAVAHGQNRLV